MSKVLKGIYKRFLILGGFAALVACGDGAIYDSFVSIDKNGWHQDSVIVFEVTVSDTSNRFEIFLTVRNNQNYPYSNLFLFREIETKGGIEFRDTAQYLLADRYGKWLGKGIGALRTNTFIYRNQALRFTKVGIYTFTLQHAMRDELLVGIEDIGLRILPAND
jgi:gliding motility-associated lipoprotein GldH